MFGYYSAPSHFTQYPSRSAVPHYAYPPYTRAALPSTSTCGQQQQYYRHHHPSSTKYIFRDDDPDDEEAAYYEYLDAARRRRERAELLEAQARRRAKEERALALAQAQAQAKAQREYEREREERRYREYVQRQLEARRAAVQLRDQQEAQDQQERQRKITRECQARQQQEQQKQQHLQISEDELARAIFGQLGWHSTQRRSSPAATPGTHSAKAKATHTREAEPEPAVKPLLPIPSSSPLSQSNQPKTQTPQPRMSYMAAVTLIQGLAKQQISLRQRLRQLSSLQSEFSDLQSSFSMPESYVISTQIFPQALICVFCRLIFDSDKSTDAGAPILAYTAQNLPLRAQEEALTRLLTKLDAIPSNGSTRVRDERKKLASAIQAELDQLDAKKVNQWKKQQRQHEPELVTDKEPSPATVSAPIESVEAQIEAVGDAEQDPVVPAAEATTVESESQDNQRAASDLSTATASQNQPTSAAAGNRSNEVEPSEQQQQAPVSQQPEPDPELGTASHSPLDDLAGPAESLVRMDVDDTTTESPAVESEIQHIDGSWPDDSEEARMVTTTTSFDASTSLYDSQATYNASVSPTSVVVQAELPVSQPEPTPSNDQSPEPDQPASSHDAHTHDSQEPTSLDDPQLPAIASRQTFASAPGAEGAVMSNKSVSATLLPTPGALSIGMVEVIEPADVEHDRASDSGSDTSFEML